MSESGPRELVIGLFVLFLVLLPGVFYVRTLYRALNRCAPESRVMKPGLVWLLFIPIFNLIWHFLVVDGMTKSLRNEFQRRGISELDLGHGLGMATCVLSWLCKVPLLGILAFCAALSFWIAYWMKIAALSRRLATRPDVPVTGSSQ